MEKKTIILVVLALVAVMNVVSFSLMGYDKRCARQGKWCVPERRLFLVTACFGGLGGVLGMKVFHQIRPDLILLPSSSFPLIHCIRHYMHKSHGKLEFFIILLNSPHKSHDFCFHPR